MTKKAKKEIQVEDLSAVCEDCGESFQRSKFSSNQKVCQKCAHARKLVRIKAKNVLKRKIASLRSFAAWAADHKVSKKDVESVRAKLLNKKTSKRYQFFKANYSQYVASMA